MMMMDVLGEGQFNVRECLSDRFCIQRAITGMSSGAFFDNLWSKYLRAGELLSRETLPKDKTDRAHVKGFYVFADVTTSFMILVGVFFPSATGRHIAIARGEIANPRCRDHGRVESLRQSARRFEVDPARDSRGSNHDEHRL
jgi:hypothetical protein